MKDYYKIMGLTEKADFSDVILTYNKLKENTSDLSLINEAYYVLRSYHRRRNYDEARNIYTRNIQQNTSRNIQQNIPAENIPTGNIQQNSQNNNFDSINDFKCNSSYCSNMRCDSSYDSNLNPYGNQQQNSNNQNSINESDTSNFNLDRVFFRP